MLSSALDAASLYSAPFIETLIPSLLDQVLYLPYSRYATSECPKTLRLYDFEVASEHLNVVIATEMVPLTLTFDFDLPDVAHGRMAEVGCLYVWVLRDELAKHIQDSGWRIFYMSLLLILEQSMQPIWQSSLVGVAP